MKKEVLRMCVISREKLPKRELIRVVKNKDEEATIDPTGKLNGRGAYLKKDLDIIKKARQNKVLDKILETNISTQLYEDLLELIGGREI